MVTMIVIVDCDRIGLVSIDKIRQTLRQTDRKTDRWIDRQIDGQSEIHSQIQRQMSLLVSYRLAQAMAQANKCTYLDQSTTGLIHSHSLFDSSWGSGRLWNSPNQLTSWDIEGENRRSKLGIFQQVMFYYRGLWFLVFSLVLHQARSLHLIL